MKRLTKTFSVLLILFAMLAFTACKDKNYSVYIFTSTGGTVSVGDSNEQIELKEIIRFKKKGSLTLHANAKENHSFLYWEVNSYVYSKSPTLEISFKGETVIKANFKHNLEGEYLITFVNESDIKIEEYTIKYDEFITIPTVPIPDGYKAVFYDKDNEENILTSGSKFSYGENKIFKLKYIPLNTETQPETFTVTPQTNANCSFELVNGSSWTVQKGGNIKFKVNVNTGYKITSVKAGTNALTADALGVYTISNINSNLILTATVELISTPLPDPIVHTITAVNGKGYTFGTFDIINCVYISCAIICRDKIIALFYNYIIICILCCYFEC